MLYRMQQVEVDVSEIVPTYRYRGIVFFHVYEDGDIEKPDPYRFVTDPTLCANPPTRRAGKFIDVRDLLSTWMNDTMLETSTIDDYGIEDFINRLGVHRLLEAAVDAGYFVVSQKAQAETHKENDDDDDDAPRG